MSRRCSARILLYASLLGLLFLGGCKGTDKEPEARKPRPVVTFKVRPPLETRSRVFTGVSKAGIETQLSFRVGGEIEKLPVKVGMRVRRGDLIARLDDNDYRLRAKEAQAGLAQAVAALNKARADYERARYLYEAGNVSKESLDTARAGFKSDEALVEAARERLELARTRIRYTTLKAPMSGAIAEVPVEVHQTVQAGQSIAMLTGGGSMEITVGVPESLIGRMRKGDAARVSFSAIRNRVYKGRVVEVGVESRGLTTYPLKLEIMDDDGRILPGMIGEVRLELPPRTSDGYLVVPSQAVASSSDGEHYVWVVETSDSTAEHTVSRREVDVAGLSEEGIMLRTPSQVHPGDLVVVRGVHRIKDGQKVLLLDAPQSKHDTNPGAEQ
ncbi:MAG: efflux RND transporter periplasmic adaptor subunit [Desulfovibrio sp.]|uniref:efflux RND transporter periplasmic adaptor subunit n=1 Tax=Desulfovibrio sp. 7SRBS1 TaxID=3378064 RepID=UPI003B40C868